MAIYSSYLIEFDVATYWHFFLSKRDNWSIIKKINNSLLGEVFHSTAPFPINETSQAYHVSITTFISNVQTSFNLYFHQVPA